MIVSVPLVEALLAYMYRRRFFSQLCPDTQSECSWMYVLTDVLLRFCVRHTHSSSSSVTRHCLSPSPRTPALQFRCSRLSRSKRRHWMPVSFRLGRQPCVGGSAGLMSWRQDLEAYVGWRSLEYSCEGLWNQVEGREDIGLLAYVLFGSRKRVWHT